MPNFGEVLTQLRKSPLRELSIEELAVAAGVAANTIARASSATTCPWKKSTRNAILLALDRAHALSDQELNLASSVGLAGPKRNMEDLTRKFPTSGLVPASPAAAEISKALANFVLGSNPDETAVFQLAKELIDRLGPLRSRAVLTNTLADNSDLPPAAERETRPTKARRKR